MKKPRKVNVVVGDEQENETVYLKSLVQLSKVAVASPFGSFERRSDPGGMDAYGVYLGGSNEDYVPEVVLDQYGVYTLIFHKAAPESNDE